MRFHLRTYFLEIQTLNFSPDEMRPEILFYFPLQTYMDLKEEWPHQKYHGNPLK